MSGRKTLEVGFGKASLWGTFQSDQELADEMEVNVVVLPIGKIVLAGLPGEPFGGISVRLRNETLRDNLIILEEANGYLSYIPTAAEFPRGSYGPNASLFGPEAEEELIGAVKRELGSGRQLSVRG